MIAVPVVSNSSLSADAEAFVASCQVQPNVFRRVARVANPHGLHLRSCLEIVNALGDFDAQITIKKGTQSATAKSILELLWLAAAQGTELVLLGRGPDAEKAVMALADLLARDAD
jgi:phosphocarrier protein HPr